MTFWGGKATNISWIICTAPQTTHTSEWIFYNWNGKHLSCRTSKMISKGSQLIPFGPLSTHRALCVLRCLYASKVARETLYRAARQSDEEAAVAANMSCQKAWLISLLVLIFHSAQASSTASIQGKTPRSNTVLQLLETRWFPQILGLSHWHQLKYKRWFSRKQASFIFY